MTNSEISALKELYSDKTEAVMFAGKTSVNILSFRRSKHDFEKGWETEYLLELHNTLKQGMIVFDIGAEQGEFTAMAAKIVGCENVHIFEPTKEYWPNIKKLWGVNCFDKVGGCFDGYVDEKSEIISKTFDWPFCSEGEIFYDTNHSVPHQSTEKIISIDDYCLIKGVMPDVIMMDIEGAELSALRGCVNVFKSYLPVFFISIHNEDLIKQRSGGTRSELFEIFEQYDYNAIHIHTDHEEHYKFVKRK